MYLNRAKASTTTAKGGAEPGIEPGTSPILRESVKLPGMNPKGELYH
jgi:hypothetical protein